ncbi:protein LURP-one-related 15-like [Primulina eburnea]|uniref:protein LURP-one-related 15-like n=1 Tax=Primulina eburnea TaxID=1245227 RepID=UPI003C6C56C9
MGSSTAVINPRFCFPGEIHLTTVKKIMPISAGNTIAILKKNGRFVLRKLHLSLKFQCYRNFLCLDLTLALTSKIFGIDQRWQVYKRDSSDPDDVVFSATQFRTGELNVVLGHKKENNAWDFKVVGSWLERLQAQKKHRFRCVMKRRDTLSVTMSPNVDHSFVVGLVVILDRINDGMDDLITSCIWTEI